MITVEKEVYETVLRNSLRVNELEEENLQLKQKVTSRNKRLQKYKKLKGELATLASNRNILIKRLKEENTKLKELMTECRRYLINDYDIEDKIRLCEMIDEVLE